MNRSLLIAAATCAFAAMPLLPAAAMPRASAHAAVTSSGNAVVLVHGDHGHALSHTARVERDRDDAWARSLRRFQSSFDRTGTK